MNEIDRRKQVHYHVAMDVAPSGTMAAVFRADRKIGPFSTTQAAIAAGEAILAQAGEGNAFVQPVREASGATVLFVYSKVGETDRVLDMGVAKELAGNIVRNDVDRKYFVVAKPTDLNWTAESPAS